MIKLIALVLVISAVEGVRFLIKHKSSGTFWHPHDTSSDNPDNDSPIITYHGHHRRMVWEFVRSENEWGYIKHDVSQNKYIHPHNGHLNPDIFTPLVVYDGYHAACLFALDAHRDLVIHKSGKYAYPGGPFDLVRRNEASPPNETPITLLNILNDGAKWLFVNPDNPNQEVEIYGKPTMTGYWKRIFSALNPRADRTETTTITIGKSNTTSTTSSFKYTWEVNTGFSIGSFNFGGSLSVEKMFSSTSSQTWTKQTTRSRQISVKAGGPSVVVWQYVFEAEQFDRRSEFRSDIIADTDSLTRKPAIDVSS